MRNLIINVTFNLHAIFQYLLFSRKVQCWRRFSFSSDRWSHMIQEQHWLHNIRGRSHTWSPQRWSRDLYASCVIWLFQVDFKKISWLM